MATVNVTSNFSLQFVKVDKLVKNDAGKQNLGGYMGHKFSTLWGGYV